MKYILLFISAIIDVWRNGEGKLESGVDSSGVARQAPTPKFYFFYKVMGKEATPCTRFWYKFPDNDNHYLPLSGWIRRYWHLMVLVIFFSSVVSPMVLQAQDETPVPTITPPPPSAASLVRAEFSVDNPTPLLGEPFEVTITVNAPSPIRIINYPTFDPPMEVIEEREVEVLIDDGSVIYEVIYEVVLWEVGEYLSPGVLLVFEEGEDAQLNSIAVSSFYVQVPAQIINPEDEVLRPFAPTINLFYIAPVWYLGGLILVVLAVLIVSRVIQVSQRGVVQVVTASPADRAIAELEDLKEQQLPAVAIYELVANNLRQYIEAQFAVEAVEMTTVEVISEVRQKNLFPKAHRSKLQDVLEQADLVKFAKFQPDKASAYRLVNFAIKWLRETERLQADRVRGS